MKKILTAKWFIVAATSLLLIAGVVLSLIPGSPLGFLKVPFAAIATPVQAFVKSAGDTLSDFWAALTDGMAIRQENEEAAIRYEELKEAFHIRDTFSNYDIYGASIISREADEWFSVITIAAGKTDGISVEEGESYPVVDVNMNLVGRVIEISDSNSKILPLVHEGFSVACKVNEVNGASMLVSGDASLKNSGLCIVTNIAEKAVLEPGTEIVTSGDGGLFPEGIPVGTIVEVDSSNPLQVTATLQPYTDIKDLEDVFVMIPYVEEGAETEAAAAGTEEGN